MEMRTGMVYQIGCQDCPATYMWTNRETTCYMNKRTQESIGHPERSAVAEHAMNKGHTINWNNT